MKQTLETIGSGFIGLMIGGLLVWAQLSDLVELCRSESLQARTGHEIITASLAAQLQDVTQRHYYADQSIKQWAAKLAAEEQAKKDAYAELGVALAAAHKWTDDEGRSVLDLSPLTRWQVAERVVVGMFTGVLAKVGK